MIRVFPVAYAGVLLQFLLHPAPAFSRPREKQWVKVVVFGLLKRGGKVYTAITVNAKTETLLSIIREVVAPDSIVYTDYFRAYNALNISEFYHRRISHSKLSVRSKNHINRMENFWIQAKRHLRKFNGFKKENFHWFLKECEWHFNGGNHQQLLTQLKYWYKTRSIRPLTGIALFLESP